MKTRLALLALLGCLLFCPSRKAEAEAPVYKGPGAAASTPLPASQRTSPAPLLYVRVSAPTRTQITYYTGGVAGRVQNPPSAVGLRPGYRYRLALTNLPGRPGQTLYPTLEVLGTLQLTPQLSASSFPVTLPFTEDDIEAVLAGNLVSRLIYLEHPDRAVPRATKPGELLEFDLPPNTNLMREGRANGRPVLLVHLGDGLAEPRELAAGPLPLWSTQPPFGNPEASKWGRPLHDPYLGPRPPEEECLRDGGDRGERVGLGPEGQLRGLDPEDTVAEYTDAAGQRRVVVSNRCCLCVPRYVALRALTRLTQESVGIGLASATGLKREEAVRARVPSQHAEQIRAPEGLRGKERPSANILTNRPGEIMSLKILQGTEISLGLAEFLGRKELVQLTETQKVYLTRQLELTRDLVGVTRVSGFEQLQGVASFARVQGGTEVIQGVVSLRDLTLCCNEAPRVPDRPLVIIKCCDKHAAQVGDIVTFVLRYSNHGGRALTDIAVVDSLSGRLEYVPGSAESDRNAVFTQQSNEAGSHTLRWEITGRLLPGESGRVRFQVRIR